MWIGSRRNHVHLPGILATAIAGFGLTCLIAAAAGDRAQAQSADQPGSSSAFELRDDTDLRPRAFATASPTPPPALGAAVYRLGRGDKLKVRVYDREDLSWDVMVREDGNVQIPYLGKFEVTGHTTEEFEDLIATALRKRLNRETSVAVDVVERRPFFVVGVVTKPGSYQFQPGMLVLHAVAIAGGVVRSETGSFLAADASRETARLQTTVEEMKRLLALRARMEADRNGAKDIAASPELSDLAGDAEAKRLIAAEAQILKTSLDTLARDRQSLTASIELSDKEISALEQQLGQIKVQRALRDQQLDDYKSLNAKGLTTQQRVVEMQLAISLLERDNLEANANISRAKQNRQKAMRDLDMLGLDRKSKTEQEIVRIDEQLEKARVNMRASRKVIQQITGLPASMQVPSGTETLLGYQILRTSRDGTLETVPAEEQTAIEPGDILKVTPRVNQISTGSTNRER